MSVRRKIISVLLALALCANFLPLVGSATPVNATSTGWTAAASPEIFDGLISGDASVIYDTEEHIYKMWYTKATGLIADDPITGAKGVETLLSGLYKQSGDLLAHAKSKTIDATDAASFKAMLAYANGLSDAQLTTLTHPVKPVIAYATSPNGIKWDITTNTFNGAGIDFDVDGVAAPSVVKIGNTYHMWYTGTQSNPAAYHSLINHIYTALKDVNDADLVAPLQNALEDKDLAAFLSAVKTIPGVDYSTLMTNVSHDIGDILTDISSIGHATSGDGLTWDNVTECNFNTTTDTWDQMGVFAPSVVYNPASNQFEMFYTGLNVNYVDFINFVKAGTPTLAELENQFASAIQMKIGKATTPAADGVNFTKVAGSVFSGRTVTDTGIIHGAADPGVIRNSDGTYEMWYTDLNISVDTIVKAVAGFQFTDILSGIGSPIYYATSTAGGDTWTVNGQALAGGHGWDTYLAAAPTVLKHGSDYMMWYTGLNSNLTILKDTLESTHNLTTALSASNTKVSIGRAYSGNPTAVQTIAIAVSGPSVVAGSTITFTALGTQLDGNTIDVTSQVTWNFGTQGILSIDTAGAGTGLVAGSTTVFASLGTGVASPSVTITVTSNTSKTDPVITWANPADIAYGTALDSTQLNATADVEGSFAYSPAAGAVLGAGPQTLNATFTPTDTATYNIVSKTVTLNVTKVHLTVTANHQTKVEGTPNPELTYTISGFVNGEDATAVAGKPNLTTTATTESTSGSYPITVSIGTLSAANYDFTNFYNNTLTVTPATVVTHTLTIYYEGSGSVAVSPTTPPVSTTPFTYGYAAGTAVTLTAESTTGWTFDSWDPDSDIDSIDTTNNNVAYVTINGDKVVTAIFTANEYTLTTGVSPAGSGSVDVSTGSYNYGDPITITATNYTGYTFSNWTVAVEGSDPATMDGNPLNLTMPAANMTITANFTSTITTATLTVTVPFISTKTVDAQVSIEYWLHNTGTPWTNGTEAAYHSAITTTVNSSRQGIISITGVAPGTYDLRVRAQTSLRRLKSSVVVSAPSTSTNVIALVEGDYNGDNIVDLKDYNYVTQNFYRTVPGITSPYAKADFNADGVLDLKDYNVTTSNFYRTGDN